MPYRVEQLAEVTGVRVDTIRFYQGKGLLPPPERRGRIALYDERHVDRLREVRQLVDQGFRLAQIGRLLERRPERAPDREEPGGPVGEGELLRELASEAVGARTLSREELAQEAGVPLPLIQAAQAAGLVEPTVVGGEERFSEADLEMARTSLSILAAGFPLDELLRLAMTHARNVSDVTERAIDLFDEHVRRDPARRASRDVTEAFQALLPHATRLVALHFQRTLVNRALERLRQRGDADDLEEALAAAESAELEVAWK